MNAHPSSDVVARARGFAEQEALFEGVEHVLAATSGGADSTALALVLAALAPRFGFGLTLAHVDHGWRDAEFGETERRHVRALAAHLGCPSLFAERPRKGLPKREAAARRHRYRTLDELAARAGCQAIATGHHLGDQAETLLMRLLRGSQAVGLAGIPPRRPLGAGGRVVIRPLLDIEPDALRALCKEAGLGWVEDPSNQDLDFDRSRVRARLERRMAKAPDTHAHLAEVARRVRRRLDRRRTRLEAILHDAVRKHPAQPVIEVDRAVLLDLHPDDLDLALRQMGARIGLDRRGPWFVRRHVELLTTALARGGAIDLPHGLRIHIGTKRVWLAPREPAERLPRLECPPTTYARPPEVELGGGRGAHAWLDADLLGSEPTLRRLSDEDRFVPFGQGRPQVTRVKAWLARRGVPGLARRHVLVVSGRHGVAWVVGHRIDHAHRVRAESRRFTRLAVAP